MRFPTLYHKSKTGAIWEWSIETKGSKIITHYGIMGGTIQRAEKEAEGTNLGRSNARNDAQQAEFEAKSMWIYRVERKYSETPEQAEEEVFLPMLAADYKKKKGRGINFPCDVQPKLDGVRAVAFWDDGRVILGTRGGKEWTAPTHIIDELENILPKDMVLDGELYLHGVDFESLTSWSKKKYPETARLEYHVFDMPLDENGANLPWSQRLENMEKFFGRLKSNRIFMVPVTHKCLNQGELLQMEENFIADGYEGAMARNTGATYLFGHRSNDLQKIKSCVDDDFEIVDYTDGVGRDKGCVTWVCVTKEGKRFEARSKGVLEHRQRLFREGKQHVGKFVKVIYQNLTKDGIPRFPRSVGFRAEEDMS